MTTYIQSSGCASGHSHGVSEHERLEMPSSPSAYAGEARTAHNTPHKSSNRGAIAEAGRAPSALDYTGYTGCTMPPQRQFTHAFSIQVDSIS
eukprot:946223-Amphidinium_carterae.2